MPKIVTTGPKSKVPGTKYLQYDPAIKGELPDNLQKLYDAQQATFAAHDKAQGAFVTAMQEYLKAQGNKENVAIMLRFGKVTVGLSDRQAKAKTANTVPADALKDLGAALAPATA